MIHKLVKHIPLFLYEITDKIDCSIHTLKVYKQVGNEITMTQTINGVIVPLGDRHYLEVKLDRENVISVFINQCRLVKHFCFFYMASTYFDFAQYTSSANFIQTDADCPPAFGGGLSKSDFLN